MIDEKLKVPLSPPTSPRMSDTAAGNGKYQWQQQPNSSVYPSTLGHPQLQPAPVSGLPQDTQPPAESERPSLRSYRSFPYSLGPSSRLLEDSAQQGQSDAPVLAEFKERLTAQGPQPVGTSSLPAATFGGSAPTSPAGRLITPNSPGLGPSDEQLEDEEVGFGALEQGEEEEERPPMTAAELRAQKRKMKRFRLTHNQTRFLMSEFARQPHPDAAHRERLSREIPGLSPRQVQVWFQNRRAKLKRLTTDDRERMMRSRALPANFDMSTALHAPFSSQPPPNVGTPMPSPGNYASFGESGSMRPLTLDTMRRPSGYEHYTHQQYASPTGVTPALGAFAFTPPQSATDTISPTSAVTSNSAYSFHPHESPRRFPFGTSMGGQHAHSMQPPYPPRLHLHERLGRPFGESAGSPLRTSMSYSGLNSEEEPQVHSQQRASSFSEHSTALNSRPHQHRSLTGPNTSSAPPIGLGFSYVQMPQYANTEQQQSQRSSHVALQPSPDSQYAQYPRSNHNLSNSSTQYQQPYQPPPFTDPPIPQYQTFATNYQNHHFQSPYQPQHSPQQIQGQNHQQSFTPVPSQPHHFVPVSNSSEQEVDEGDNSEGGVPLPPSY